MAAPVPRRRLGVLVRHLPSTPSQSCGQSKSRCSRVASIAVAAGSTDRDAGEIRGPSGSFVKYSVCGQDPNHPIMEITKLFAQEESAVKELGDAVFALARERGMMVWPSCREMMTRYVAEHAAEVASLTLCEYDDQTPGFEISIRMDGLATLRLTDARRRNPLCRHIIFRLRTFLQTCIESEMGTARVADASKDLIVHAILLASTGPVFSSGHDFRDFFEASREQQAEVLQACSDVNMLLGRVPQVTVASVDGLASAGGCQLVASCDLVYASATNAKFCLPGSRDGNGFCHTPAVSVAHRATSVRKAFELAMMADEISPQDAERLGLCNSVVPGGSKELEREVEAMVTRLCKNFSVNTAMGKQTFYKQVQASTLEAKYEIAMPVMLDMFNNASYVEFMRAFVQRRSKRS